LISGHVDVRHWDEVESAEVASLEYRSQMLSVRGITIRWLSKCGDDGTGSPQYGLRFFTAEPRGEIPIHAHAYHQTVYILTGRFKSWEFDSETDELVSEKLCGPGDFIYVPGMVPHGMKNISDTESGTFLCCICTPGKD